MLEFFDGFDIPSLPINYRWDMGSGNVLYSTGRFGTGYSVLSTSYPYYLRKTLPNKTTRIVGWASTFTSLNNNSVLTFLDNTTEQISLRLTNLLELQIWSGSMLATTGTNVIRLGDWHYYEMSVTIGTSGAFQLRMDGNIVFNISSVNTQQSSNNYTNTFSFSGNSGGNVDDLYVLNTDGSKNNTFLGEQKVITTVPSSDNSINFEHNTGTSNFAAVLSIDSTFNFSKTIGDQDLFGMTPIQTFHGNEISAIQTTTVASKDDVGNRTLANIIQIGETETTLSDHFLLSNETSRTDILEQNPVTNSDWLEADVNSALFGYKITS